MSSILADRTKAVIDIFLDEIADAPTPFVGRYRGAFYPAAVGVIKKVSGGADGCIEVHDQEIRRGLLFFVMASGGRQGGQEEESVDSHDVCNWFLQIFNVGGWGLLKYGPTDI